MTSAVGRLQAFYDGPPRVSFRATVVRTFPDEMYFGTGREVPQQLAAAKVAARQARLAANRALRCQICRVPVAITD